MDRKDDRGRCLLHSAVLKGDNTIIDLLIESGANPNTLDKDKNSPLGTAVLNEKFKSAYKILKHPLVNVAKGAG